MASKIKLFNKKLGVGKKHKSHIEVTPKAVVAPAQVTPKGGTGVVVDFGDYSLPPDCLTDPDVDTDLYSEPADSLNQPNSSNRLLPGSNRSIPLRDDVFSSSNAEKLNDNKHSAKTATIASKGDQHFHSNDQQVNQHLPDLVSSHCSIGGSTLSSENSYHPDLTDSTCRERSPLGPISGTGQQVSPVSCKLQSDINNMEASSSSATERPLSMHMNNTPDQISGRDYYNQDSITRNRVNNTSAISSAAANARGRSSSTSAAPTSAGIAEDDNLSAGVYMNDSQLSSSMMNVSAADMARKASTCSSITPDMDPRNQEYLQQGNEYESPWDLEAEISQVAKQMQSNPTSPLASNTHSLSSQKSTVDVTASHPNKHQDSLRLHQHQPQKKVERSETKVDYSKQTKLISPSASGTKDGMMSAHRVRQPNVHRQSSTSSMVAVPSTSSVLVEGEWREAKTSTSSLRSPGSPELDSPAQILSQRSTASCTSGDNSASNFIYDKSHHDDSEIRVMLRYEENKANKIPCAQPRASLSMSPPPVVGSALIDDQVYQNFNDAKKSATREYETDGVYDDPWNVDQVQQEILDQLEEKQKQRTTSGGSIKGRPSNTDTAQSNRMHKRPTDLPREMSTSHDMSGTRRLLSQNSSSKLSPRALVTQPLSKQLATGPPVPKAGPGQAHSTKPVLVVHKTNGTFINQVTKDSPGSTSTRGSLRKTPSTPLEIPECQHRVGLGVNKNLPLTQQPWYHGTIQRNYAEELLRKSPDGSFLIRESNNSPRDKTLSLKNVSGFIHIKIVQQPDGTVILGQFSNPFRTIMDMVEYYSRHKVNIKGAEHTYLEIPVFRDR